MAKKPYKYTENFPNLIPEQYKVSHKEGYELGYKLADDIGYQEDYPIEKVEAYIQATKNSTRLILPPAPPKNYAKDVWKTSQDTPSPEGYTDGYNEGYLDGYKKNNKIEVEDCSSNESLDGLQSNPELQIDTQPNSPPPINRQTNSRVKQRMIAMISGNDPDQDKEFKSLTIRLSIQDYAHLSVLASRLNQSTSGLAKEIFVDALLDSIDALIANGGDKALHYNDDVEVEKSRLFKKTR